MEPQRYRGCLAADFARLRAVAAVADPGATVPSCPDWRVADLVTHLAEVYLHKSESMRLGEFPEPWPPDLSGEQPLALLDRAYGELVAQFDAREADSPAAHWYEPDQTVGCLLRRMAQETVIHRVDAELAAGGAITPIPDDLAVDGVEEILVMMLAYMSQGWPEAFDDLPEHGAGPATRVRAGTREWLLTPGPKGVSVQERPGEPAALVTADPQAMLLWLWGRVGDSGVDRSGDPAALTRLRGLLREVT